MVRVKICGITCHEDAEHAIKLGVHALGFIFARSPRQISPENAKNIISRIPPFVNSVGVFVDENPARIREIVNYCGLDYIQFHGNETVDVCSGFMPQSIKALRVKQHMDYESIKPYRGAVRAFLLDTYTKGKAGGTGKAFNWDIAVKIKNIGVPVILAGGLEPSNIEEAITTVHPYAVDINSGIEESPGKKSHTLMKELFEKIDRNRK